MFILAGYIFQSCSREDTSLGPAQIESGYHSTFERWHRERLYDLTHPTGWMRLAGLFWLEEGTQTFGGGSESIIQFPGMESDPFGEFTLSGDSVFIRIYADTDLYIDSVRVASKDPMIIYSPSTVQSGGQFIEEYAPILTYNELEWFIIKREELFGIRLYNKENDYVDDFEGFVRYPMDSSLVVKARLIPYAEPRTIRVTNILGQVSDAKSPGVLEFQIGTEIYTLTPTTEEDKLFIAFSDATNKEETFESGRYLYVDPPAPGSGMTVIDFNKSYNPPCSYSSFSTCQLPPPENWLKIAVYAGEKRPEVKF